MSQTRFGEPVPDLTSEKVASDSDETPTPGLRWGVSEDALREIERIEKNIRWAEQHTGQLLMR